MKILGIVVKIILSIMIGAYMLTGGDIIYSIVWGGIIYGMLSFCAYYLKESGFSFTVWIGEKGIFMTLLSVVFALFAPLIGLSLFTLAMNSILPNGIGAKIAAFLVIVMCIAFLVRDAKIIISIFRKGSGEGEGR